MKTVATVRTLRQLCHIIAYFVAFLKFYPSNSQRKCRDHASMWHSLVSNSYHAEISPYPMYKPPPLFFPVLACIHKLKDARGAYLWDSVVILNLVPGPFSQYFSACNIETGLETRRLYITYNLNAVQCFYMKVVVLKQSLVHIREIPQ